MLLDRFQERGYPPEKIRLVLNVATMDGAVSRKDTEKRLGAEFAHVVPADQALVTHSVNRGVPLVMSHPRSAVARAIRKLSQALVDDLNPEEAGDEEARQGLLKRVSLPGRSSAEEGPVDVIQTVSLGQGRTLYLIMVGERVFLVAWSQETPTLIGEIERSAVEIPAKDE